MPPTTTTLAGLGAALTLALATGCAQGTSTLDEDRRGDGGLDAGVQDTTAADTTPSPDIPTRDSGPVITRDTTPAPDSAVEPDSTVEPDSGSVTTDTGAVGDDTDTVDTALPDTSADTLPTDTGATPDTSDDVAPDTEVDTAHETPDTSRDTDPACPDDGLGISTMGDPHLAGRDYHVTANTCSPDWIAFDMVAGERLTMAMNYDHSAGNIDAQLVIAGGEVVAHADALTGHEGFTYDAPVARRVYLHVYDRGPDNTYTMTVTIRDGGGVVEPGEVTIRGTARYEDRPVTPGPSGPGAGVARPIIAAPVDLVDAASERVLTSTFTDATGGFALTFEGVEGADYYVRVAAQVDGARYTAAAGDQDGAIYAIRTDARTLTSGSLGSVDLTARADRPYAAAYNLVENARLAYETLLPYVGGAAAPALTFVWQEGLAHACTSCYLANTIYIGGGYADPDEWDDDVILHEFGHYFVDAYSVDESPGGPHGSARDTPKLAYSEGMATAIQAIILQDPFHADSTPDYTGAWDIDNLSSAQAFQLGTSDGSLSGEVSEWLVAAILWDFYDPADEANDTIAAGYGPFVDVLAGYMADRPWDMGATGVDFADWLNGATCDHSRYAAGLATLAGERSFPWRADDAACPKPSLRPSVRIVEEQGQLVVELVRVDPWSETWVPHGGLEGLPGDASAERVLDIAFTDRLGTEHYQVVCAGRCTLGAMDPDAAYVIRPTHPETLGASWVGADRLDAILGGTVVESPWGALRQYVVEP